MKLNIKSLIYLPLFFFFLPAFGFYLPGIGKVYNFFYISLYIVLLILFMKNGKRCISEFILITKKTPLIYFFIFFIYIAIDSIFLSFTGITTIKQTLFSIIMRIFLCILPTLIYFIYIINNKLGLKNFIKIFMFAFWLNLILGIISYLGRWFDISVVNAIFDFFNNTREIGLLYNTSQAITAEQYFAGGKRLCGLFEEPGYLCLYIFLFLPFVYTFASKSSTLFKNKIFNIMFKNTIIPLAWINLILTLSPINLIFSLIITFVYYFRQIKNFIVKYRFFVLMLVSLVWILFSSNIFAFDISETYLMRIVNILTNVKTFNDFIIIEPSLATRAVSYINELCVFMQHPITGIGFGNIENKMYQQFLVSPVPFTYEIITKSSNIIGNKVMFNKGFMYTILAENGLFAYVFFISLLLIYYKRLNDLIKKGILQSFDYQLMRSMQYIVICVFIETFYELELVLRWFHIIIILLTLIIYTTKIKLENSKEKINE